MGKNITNSQKFYSILILIEVKKKILCYITFIISLINMPGLVN